MYGTCTLNHQSIHGPPHFIHLCLYPRCALALYLGLYAMWEHMTQAFSVSKNTEALGPIGLLCRSKIRGLSHGQFRSDDPCARRRRRVASDGMGWESAQSRAITFNFAPQNLMKMFHHPSESFGRTSQTQACQGPRTKQGGWHGSTAVEKLGTTMILHE